MSDEGVHLNIDPMLFLGLVIEDQIAMIDSLTGMPFGDPSITAGVIEVAHEKIAEAQAGLDRLIEEDTSWRPL
jgi:hypothetical protein